jgi:uncharacterized peroxidase-related enzyme
MTRIQIPGRDDAPLESKPILDAVFNRLGFVPNLHRMMSISAPALSGVAALQKSLSTVLDIKTRLAIALAVSETNGCEYCVATHSHAALNDAQMSPREIALNRMGSSSDARRAAAAGFAKELIEKRGKVNDDAFISLRAAGFVDRDIIDIITLTAQYLLTNFMNNAAGTEIDFPKPVSDDEAATTSN